MDVFKQIHEENAKHDPHGFKSQGADSAKHLHANAPYRFEKFPHAVHKVTEKGTAIKNVHSDEELEAAIAEGWSVEAPKPE